MNFQKFALVLVAVQIPALSASALEQKPQHHNSNRITAAHSGASVEYTAQRPSKMKPVVDLSEPYFTSANGS